MITVIHAYNEQAEARLLSEDGGTITRSVSAEAFSTLQNLFFNNVDTIEIIASTVVADDDGDPAHFAVLHTLPPRFGEGATGKLYCPIR